MKYKSALSSVYNMALGFLPIVTTGLLRLFATWETAVFAGIGFGILYLFWWQSWSGLKIPNLMLCISTGVLIVYALAILVVDFIPKEFLLLALEICIIISVLVFCLFKNKLHVSFHVATQVLLIFGCIHLVAIVITFLFVHSPNDAIIYWLFQVSPSLVFGLSILFNQIGISYFNRIMAKEKYIPVVDKKGRFIGKMPKEDILINAANIYPFVRIVIFIKGMLFLASCQEFTTGGRQKIDTPLQSYVLFDETLEEVLSRMVGQLFPDMRELTPVFSIRYFFDKILPNRFVYLYLLEIEDEKILKNKQVTDGKLWLFRQIYDNMEKGVLGDCLEYECEHLNRIICIREKYKGF
ncbi:hypothetical protein EZS27_018968 [termite gut metagenome]|uniref:Uncharacterized protein n=1 Tax=termite gut metagenome TaxID=433724 RepID=A0A5J4REK3_9ZZZZ